MAASSIFALVEPESKFSSKITSLERVVPRDTITAGAPSEHELDGMRWGQKLNGPPMRNLEVDVTPSPTPRHLESSRPSTPHGEYAVDAIVQSWHTGMNKHRLASTGIVFFLSGLNDAATGALIPSIEKEYNIGYAVVSLLFITNATGFIAAAPFIQMIEAKLGRSQSYILATTASTIGYTTLICAPPFPVVVLAFFFLGFGTAMFLAMTNVWIVNLLNGTVILGFMHGLYGVGGILSPIVATAMVTSGIRWSFFYCIPLAMTVSALVTMGWTFKDYEKESSVQLLSALERSASRQAVGVGVPTKWGLLRLALQNRTTLLGALFILFYQGGEVAISGWVISFLISYRKGDPAQVGNVTSGFWAGITLGRFALTHLAHRLGEKRSVLGLVALAAVFQVLVWFVPNIIGDAVAQSIVGLFLGPVYPCATAVFSRLLPMNVQIAALSFVTSMGSSGGALIPFITGLLAQKIDTVVLHPIVLFSCMVMCISWSCLPKIAKRTE